MTSTAIREIEQVVKGQATMDGDGVRMTRIIGSQQLNMLDPFLLLDHFESDRAEDSPYRAHLGRARISVPRLYRQQTLRRQSFPFASTEEEARATVTEVTGVGVLVART